MNDTNIQDTMKKLTLLFTIAILAFYANAQGVSMGLTASPQVAWMQSDAAKVKNDGAVMGFNFGLNSDFYFAERYSLTTGLTINNTGGKLLYADSVVFKTSDGTETFPAGTSIRYRIQYLDIPLAFKLESNKIGYFVYYAQFGITNHFKVGASADVESQGIDGAGCKEEVAFYNMSYHIGGGFDYYVAKNTAITIGISYSSGFIDATPDSDKKISDNVSIRSLTLKLGVLF